MAMRRHWSPEPENVTGIQAKAFRHDPYGSPESKIFYYTTESPAAVEPAIDLVQIEEPPMGTRHMHLWGRVTFVPYPTSEFYPPAPPTEADGELVRVFLGQLPYFVTDMQLSWLCHTFGGFNAVASPERIMKRQPNGERLPTGCIHAYATVRAVEEMAAGMHKRMLVDDTGVWHAQTEEELDVLSTYVAMMKSDKGRRVPGRPYDTVVVQMATSTFVPRHVASKPHLAATSISESADEFRPTTRPPNSTGKRTSQSRTSTQKRAAPSEASGL